MYECSDLSVDDYLNLSVASNVMSRLANWMLLVIFVYILNSMLLKQLETTSSGSKTVSWLSRWSLHEPSPSQSISYG